eukprot:jgi/Phyca11/21187/fgenesh1_pg.PHYCAscaffold_84_\
MPKPSEILTAFSTAKAHAAKHATSRIVELVNAEDHTARVSSTVPLHQPLFQPTPTEVWIDEYTPFEPLTIKLRFRNCDTVVRRLKIEPPRSPVFRVRPWDAGKTDRVDGKVAAGMEIAFALEFFPQEVTDYSLDLVCCTERERFLLPVRVRGRFAALDLPDELEFGSCPVKMASTRVLTVRNVGTRSSSFAFQTSENFQVTPPSATLAQGAAVQIELSLVPPDLESGEGQLEAKDDSGQTAVVQLMGRVVNVDVFLSQPLAEPSATYLSLSSRTTIKICNESEFTLDFSWKSFADVDQEETERSTLLEELGRLEAAEHEQLHPQNQEEEEDANLELTQSPFDVRKILDTKYRHLRKAALDDSMQFVDACFSLTPLSGRVWAHSEVDVVVCFTPEIARLYSCCAFLEVAGQAARLPLRLRGQGIGPKAKVVYNELLDFGDVFINDERTRDFTIQNKGEIPAEFELIPLAMPPGTSLTVQPSQGTLAVNAMLKVEVTFCSQELGEAFHHIRFSMQGSDEQLTVRFKARVIPPVFHFDVDQVDFGAVSYSFPQTRTIKLINSSKIAMNYSLRVPEEASYKQKEMELDPSDGKLDAYGEQQVSIRFTSYNVKVYQYQLVVGVTGVGADLLSIPVRAQCFVPELVIFQQELDFGRCFLRYPHKQLLVIENKSTHLFGRFEISEQDDHSRAIATYSTSSGPKVELDQPEINWGNCTCLVDHERVLRMTNVSLIPAVYKTFIRNARSKFQIDKKEGILMAGETLDFVLVANLDDTVVFKDQLHILITEGDNLVVPLSIRGTGTTMWSPSELRVIDFSHQMTSKECEWSCTLENKGKRLSSTAGLLQEELVCETRVGKEKVSKVAFVTAIRANFVDPKLTPTSSLLSFEYIHHPGNQITPQTQPLSLTNACELPLSFTLRTQTPFALDCWEAVLQPGEKVDLNVEFYPGFKDDYTCRVINGKVLVAYTGHPQKDSVELLGDISFPNLSFEMTKIDFGCTLNDTQKSISMNVTNVSKVDTSFRWIFIEDEKEALSTATAKKPYIPINQVFDILPIRGLLKPNESEKIEFVYYGHANRKFKSTVACEVEGGPEYELTLLGEASSLVYKLDKQSLDFGQVLYNKTEDRDFSILNVGKVPFSFNILIDSVACARPPSSTSEAKTQKKRQTEVFPFILSQFVLDFGNVVVGTHKFKRFSVTNIGHGPASFQLDKNLASSKGFQIEPERVVRLPEKQSVEFNVTFHARKNIAMGLHVVQLPIVIKNGPPCIVMARALVTVPDISISSESLDFGKMAVSTCHTMFTQLQNVSAVAAEWAFKKPMGSTKDVGNFRFTPQSGLLAPGAKVNIQIEFIPDDGRQFMLKLPIKINSNPKTRSIVLEGSGESGGADTESPPQENEDVVSQEPADSAMEIPIADFNAAPRKGIDYIVMGPPSLGFEIVGVRREFTLFGRGICAVPTINSDPRNVFMHRVKSRPEGGFVQKKFVISRNQFEFGPLIIPNQPVKAPETEREFIEWQKSSPNNIEVFRMSNSSRFPIQLEFAMEKQDDATFVVYPTALEVKEGETREVKVWANPKENGLHENAVICCISDNPEPVQFPISCYGCTPELKLCGPWEQPAAASTSEREDQAALLLKRQDEKTFYIENVSPVAVSWRLLDQDLPADFRVFPLEGTVKPLQKVPVVVVFSAGTEAVHEFPLRIEFSDAESALQLGDRNRLVELTVRGEAYKIDVSSFDNEVSESPAGASGARSVTGDGSLDYGLVRVGETHSRAFNIKNQGKYSIKYIISIRNPVTREYFTIEPSEMVLEPGQSSSVSVAFSSKSEVTLRDCRDIKCTIIEMLSGEACREFFVYTSARSVFSKFRLQPNRGINFGPHKFSDQAQMKRIEIRNDGEFQFKFRVQSSRPETSRKDPLMIDTPLSPATLSLGQFSVSPDCGSVDPGVTMGLDVGFQPKDCAVYCETLQIEISGRNWDDMAETNTLLYELVGESCYPGINTTDFESIFEEQTVVRSLGVESAVPTLRSGSFPGSIQAVTFAEKEKVFSFGPLIAAANWKGTVERFKISNPMKNNPNFLFAWDQELPGHSGMGGYPLLAGDFDDNCPFEVAPSVGSIRGGESQVFTIKFAPMEVNEYFYYLNFEIPDQLELQEMFWYFKIPHFQVNQLFLFVGTTTEPRVALDRGSVNFNTLLIGTKTSQSIALVNQEHIPFNFVFDKTSLDFAGELPALIVHPLSGVIPPNSRTSIEIEFIPTEEKSYSFNLNCIVKRKPTRLSLNVKGEGYSIHDALTLECDDHNESRTLLPGPGNVLDFGAVRVNEEAQRSVVVHNSGKFNFDFSWTLAKPSAAFTIEPMQGTIKKNDKATIRGEGVFPKVELVNSSMQMVVLGNLQIGQQVSRTVKVVNRSKRKTMMECMDTPQPGVASLEALGISIFPQQEFSLRAKESADIEFRFAPTQRTPSFQKEVSIRVGSSKKKLLTLSGCCQGIEVVLETDTLSYGAVCLGSQLVRKIRLQNRGDVATKFHWNVREFAPDFVVSPSEGMVAPNQYKTIEVTFKPVAVNPDIRYERVTCLIERTAPATLTLVGSCVPQSTSSIQDVHFDSPVRQETHKEIILENTTASPWNLFPVVQGEHWSCPENVLVPAHGKANLDVLYSPLTMTKQNSQEEIDIQRPTVHNGSVFLAIPDGSALLYNLFGKASAPVPATTISLSTAAKKTLSISIPIKNWLKSAQTFTAEIQKPPGNDSIIVQGPSSVLLHASATRSYNMKFFCYTEGLVNLAVQLVNQESGEYLTQDVLVAVSKAVDVDTLYFEAPHQINFVDKDRWWQCSSSSIRVRQLGEISGRSEGSYEIEYRPTLHSETPIEGKLTINFVELGEYTYKLVLNTQAVGSERILYFKAPLGGSQTQTFTFTSYAEAAAELSCSVHDPTSFSVPESCKVEGSSSWDGKHESITVKFEPEAIGDFRDTLTLFSETVGEYKCTLQGLSVPPLPQGPYVFSTTKDIEFKNVFSTPHDFDVIVDNPRFVLSTTSLSIPAKSSRVIT